MPKRTNEFQQLILLIQSQLASSDAEVTESYTANDTQTQSKTEVDICIYQCVNGIPIRIGMECNSEKRPATVEWVREMLGKYAAIEINKLVLVAKSGFTKEALSKAESNDVLALTLEEATNANWRDLIAEYHDLQLGSFKFDVLEVTVHFASSVESKNATIESVIHIPTKEVECSLGELALSLLQRKDFLQHFFRVWLNKPSERRRLEGESTARCDLHDETFFNIEEDEWHAVKALETKFTYELIKKPLPLEAASLNDQQIAFSILPNEIFPDKPARHLVVNLLADNEGRLARASILIPHKEAPEILHMDRAEPIGEIDE